jgi:hypothetical protein
MISANVATFPIVIERAPLAANGLTMLPVTCRAASRQRVRAILIVRALTTDAAKLFASFYALYSGIVFLAATGVFVAPFLHRVLHRMHATD